MIPEQVVAISLMPENGIKLVSGTPNDSKTLLYGYDCDRNTWHTFQDATGYLFSVVYNHDGELVHRICGRQLSAAELIPNKRLYPEACDFEFCKKIKTLGIDLPFTTYGTITRKPDGKFWGKIFP